MSSLTIKELQSRNEVMEAFPVLRQLRTHLNEGSYLELVSEAQEKRRLQNVRFIR